MRTPNIATLIAMIAAAKITDGYWSHRNPDPKAHTIHWLTNPVKRFPRPACGTIWDDYRTPDYKLVTCENCIALIRRANLSV